MRSAIDALCGRRARGLGFEKRQPEKSGRFRVWRARNARRIPLLLDASRVLALKCAWKTGVTFAEAPRL